MSNQPGKMKPRFIVGAVFIVFALLMLFDNLGLHFIGRLLSHWPIGLMLIGGALIYGPFKEKVPHAAKTNLPYFLIGFGALFFLAQHNFFNFSFSRLIGPAILLAIGVHILRPEGRRGRNKKDVCNEAYDSIASDIEDEISGVIDELSDKNAGNDTTRIEVFNVLGGSEFSSYSKHLTGGNVVCIMGGAEIDIREADADSDTIEIEIIAFMGGAEIKVPAHWQVSIKAIPFLGGVSNKTTCLAHKLNLPKKHLIVSGVALMGGIDVRN